MTDATPKPVTFEDITRLGQKRVDDTRVFEIPALGGTVKLRQLSGADQDAAVALAQATGTFDAHALYREQIKRSMVEPQLPEADADTILDNLPIQAFGQLQAVVQANSGLNGLGVEELVRSFRLAAIADSEDAAGGDVDDDTADDDGMGPLADTDAADGVESVSQVAGDGTGPLGQEAGDSSEAGEQAQVTA